ncbi:MAG: ABC transporter substrate-binding protein [Rhodospirillales bacterium]|nr:ABC transporter substrate-binding protein [Rhodospirillales bacterium]
MNPVFARRSFILGSGMVLSGLGLASRGEAAAPPDTLVVGIAADPTGFDPEAVLNNTSGFVMATVFDGLMKYKPGTTDPEPGLAQSYEVSPDGLTYTFRLRPNVSFHDGTPLNAKTYLAGIDRLLNKANPNYIYNTGPVEGYIDFTYGSLASYTAKDDMTVVFVLKAPSAPFLTSLAMVWNGVASPTAAAKYGKSFRQHPVGTGPFIFREWRPRDAILLDANPGYWNGRPKVGKLVFKEYPDPSAGLLALKNGDMHIWADTNTELLPAIRADRDLTILTQPGLAVSGVGMPCDTPPFTDVRVRQAFNYAVDKNAMDKALYQGLAAPMTSPLPASEWSFDPSLKGYPYDPAKAKSLLAAAGVAPGFAVELLAYNSGRGYNPVGPDLAVAVQGYLEKVGVKVTVRKIEFGAYLTTIRSSKYKGMFLVGWTGDNGDPDNFLNALFGGSNIPVTDTVRYRNPVLDALFVKGLKSNSHAERVKIYQRAQRIILDAAPWIFINSVLQVRAVSNRVKGYQLNPTQMFFDMEKVSLT